MSELKVRVPTSVVRNENVQINNGDFLLYMRLCFLYFRNYKQEEIHVDHKKLMFNLNIGDSRTLKKRFINLHKAGLVRNKINKIPRGKEVVVLFNGDIIKKDKHFTQMNVKLFDYVDMIDEHAIRLLFYYKSHINLKDQSKDRSFCYVGIETLKNKLKMGSDTVNVANKLLVKHKLIKIVRHKLNHDYEYNEKDELIYDRYNNHYYVDCKLF